jgi:hypothetical protein
VDSTTEATIAIIAAFLVLLSATWNPAVSAVIAVTTLAALGIYKLAARKQ